MEFNAKVLFLNLRVLTRLHLHLLHTMRPIPVAALSKAWLCGRSLAGIVGSKPPWGTDVYLL